MRLKALILAALTLAGPCHADFLIGGVGNLQTIGSGATRYFGTAQELAQTTPTFSSFVVPNSCSAARLFVRTGNAQSGTGALVFTVITTALSATVLTVTVGAGAAAGVYSNTADSFAFPTGTSYVLRGVNGASATSAQLVAWSFECRE